MATDNLLKTKQEAWLASSPLREWSAEATMVDYGAILLCKSGRASVNVNYHRWQLHKGAVLVLFPGDLVMVENATHNCEVTMLSYSDGLLREACLQLEHTVYSLLRARPCRDDTDEVTQIVSGMMQLLTVYFAHKECTCTAQVVKLQLASFFTGFHDYLYRHPEAIPPETGTRRVNELFNAFMHTLERHHKESREVAYYARALHITPKYLNNIVRAKTALSPKEVIDHYTVLQIKLQLRTTDRSLKQISWDFHFSDFSFFSRYFKAHTGATPRDYRHQVALDSIR